MDGSVESKLSPAGAEGLPLLAPCLLARAESLRQRFVRRLPKVLFELLHRPLPRSLRGASWSEEDMVRCRRRPLPPQMVLDPGLDRRWGREIWERHSPLRPPGVRLHRAWVLPDGTILHGQRISRFSAVYRGLTLAKYLALGQWWHRMRTGVPILRRAALVSRSLIDSGTYGDYVIEFLLPLSWAVGSCRDVPILLDADYVRRFASEDLASLGLEGKEIPPEGLCVEDLLVLGPCQFWDNFQPENVRRIREALPCREAGIRARQVYLSRVGTPPSGHARQRRVIENEETVEAHLRQRGFHIVRTAEMTNPELRSLLKGADVVVGSHGAAFAHLLWGTPSVVIELVSETWWVPCYLKLSWALRVRSYRALVARSGKISLSELDAALENSQMAIDAGPVPHAI